MVSWRSMAQKRPKSGTERVSRGEEQRNRILREAIRMTSEEGLQSLTIGRMAAKLAMSKSGLFAHFGSKRKLQLATIDRAYEIFEKRVLTPLVERGPKGIFRIWILCDLWIKQLETRLFPSGYFFTGAFMEYGERRGSLAGSLRAVIKTWLTTLQSAVEQAQDLADLKSEPSAEEMAFELNALLVGAYWGHLAGSKRAYSVARLAIVNRLRAWATEKISSRVFESTSAWKKHVRAHVSHTEKVPKRADRQA